MIRLTPVQTQVLTALGRLVTPGKKRHSLAEIYIMRLSLLEKQDPQGVLKRTTENTLKRLRDYVPRLVTGGPVTWGLTHAGVALLETQLGVTHGRTETVVEDRDHDLDGVGPTADLRLRPRTRG